jgi:hypothetical protein
MWFTSSDHLLTAGPLELQPLATNDDPDDCHQHGRLAMRMWDFINRRASHWVHLRVPQGLEAEYIAEEDDAVYVALREAGASWRWLIGRLGEDGDLLAPRTVEGTSPRCLVIVAGRAVYINAAGELIYDD